MYHPATVEEKIERDGADAVFVVETWDNNLFTLDAGTELDAAAVAEGDVVLLDYSADDRFEVPTPRQVVAVHLPGETGDRIWERYRAIFEETQQAQTDMMPAQNQPFEGGYIG